MTDIELKQNMIILSRLLKEMKLKEAEFEKENRDLAERIENLKTEVKEEILKRQDTVRIPLLTATYRKGAVKWDTKWLDGFAIEHPEYQLGRYRKVGDPTVAFSLPKEMEG